LADGRPRPPVKRKGSLARALSLRGTGRSKRKTALNAEMCRARKKCAARVQRTLRVQICEKGSLNFSI
jgi:hypothetical protein